MKFRLFALVVSVCACTFNPAPAPNAFYDFGPRPENPSPSRTIEPLLLIETVHAPSWLDTQSIVYRLGEDARHRSYANSHWVGPPGDLITARLAGKLAGASEKGIVRAGQGIAADYSLRVELIEFAHVFDSPQTSRGVIQLRASLIDRGSLVAQKSFAAAFPAPSPDAPGAVRALSNASDAAIAEIVEWVATTLGGLKNQK